MKLLVLADSWSITVDAFRSALERRWPGTSIMPLSSSEVYSIMWESQDPELTEGRLSKEGDCIVMEGNIEGCASVAAWFRELVPAAQAVTFFDQGYNADVNVRPGMTADVLAAAYITAANS